MEERKWRQFEDLATGYKLLVKICELNVNFIHVIKLSVDYREEKREREGDAGRGGVKSSCRRRCLGFESPVMMEFRERLRDIGKKGECRVGKKKNRGEKRKGVEDQFLGGLCKTWPVVTL
ncbi:hypothetical protein CCACVL1_23084 [Corchorus capsularis]|uniref:Uncharacterized protein n=1 Tax=Corchorus capsularis TaxID=210143 RepID=A0A1R3GVC2_COCAP|nr:hypothetical protein CCACVL1_23084 [Corchorus capsularis]